MTPICKPMVNADLDQMNGLQRGAESFRYIILCVEQWISPEGTIRNWLRLNWRLCAWLIIPGFIVMPVISLILWQLAFWLSMFTGIVGKLIVLTVVVLVVRRMTKR